MNSSHKEQILRILEKLQQVREQNPKDLGAETHRYELNPPIQEQELLDFEAEHGVQLPEEYRDFLLYAGNGGAGPYYGIYPLEKWYDFGDWIYDTRVENYLSLPCPLYFRMKRTDDWEKEFETKFPFQGTLSLGSQGCTYAMVLIVTGEYRGRVVYADADGQTPFVTYEPDFLTWYERWLDELLSGCEIFWFGMNLGGAEEDLLEILRNPETTAADKTDALDAFWRIKQISDEAEALIPTFLSASDSDLQASACRMVRRFELLSAEETVGKMLSDPAPGVRQEAIETLIKFNPARWCEKIFPYLYDVDLEVTKRAFQALNKAKSLSRSELLGLIKHPPNEEILYNAVYTIQWEAEDQELLIRLLDQQQDEIRFYATLGLRQIRAREAIENVIELLEKEPDPRTRGSILKMLGEIDSDRSREILLLWTEKGDDFERLDAVEGLCQLGDERVIPVAKRMLQETRSPSQVDPRGFGGRGHTNSIGQLVDESLQKSRSRAIRKLSSKPFGRWWIF